MSHPTGDALNASQRAQAKARYQAYQRAAQQFAAPISLSGYEIRVPVNPDVQVVEGGAFVEAYIWVPVEAVDGTAR